MAYGYEWLGRQIKGLEVFEDACLGCGACYWVCPVEGAIEIITKG